MKNICSVFKIFLLPLCFLVLQSCLKEDTDDCIEQRERVRIVVRTLAEEVRAARGSYQIENVHIYIFDEQRCYFGMWQGGEYTPGEVYEAYLEMDPGIYHFVVWTNQGDVYDKTIATYGPNDPAEDLIVGLQYPSDRKIDYDVPDLHHGICVNAEVVAQQDNEFTVIIKPNTYQLNFTVEGLSANDDEYEFKVRDNNSHYTFDNSIVGGLEELEYVRVTNFSQDGLGTSMKVLRLEDGRSPQFDFSDLTVPHTFHSDDLVAMIKKAYNSSGQAVDFDQTYEFDIELKFDANLGLTVTVNNWKYTYNETEL